MKPAHGFAGYAGEHQSGALARPRHERWSGVNRLRRFNITRGCAKCVQSPTKLAWCPHRYGLRPSRPSGSHKRPLSLAPLPVNTATRSTSITSGEGQQNGAGEASPLRLLLLGRLRRFILPVYLLSLHGLFVVPRPPSLSGYAGSRCAAPSRSPATPPLRPKWLPKNKQGRTGEGVFWMFGIMRAARAISGQANEKCSNFCSNFHHIATEPLPCFVFESGSRHRFSKPDAGILRYR